jgi:protein tyrosine phosphatase (PTP) superfamily phosphohydrolase (DUF442 family)
MLKLFALFDPVARYHRLARSAAAWESEGLRTPSRRLRAWLDLLVLDHGLIRLVYPNRHRVSDELWRSGQLAPWDLRRLASKGLRTVISVRGGRALGGRQLEREACERLALKFLEIDIRGREAPSRDALLTLIDLFETVEYPVLIHCKSGADRTGFAAALYLLAREQCPLSKAKAQLSLRFGHWRASRAGILGAVLDAYGSEGLAAGLDLRGWVQSRYEPDKINGSFRPPPLITVVTSALTGRCDAN